jgi:hypothetical protein
MELTVAFDLELNCDEDFLPKGKRLKVVEDAREHEGYIAVLITDALSYNNEPVEFIPFVDYFTPESFVEYKN